jgi:dTDP-4-dehydrorhamnose reductase
LLPGDKKRQQIGPATIIPPAPRGRKHDAVPLQWSRIRERREGLFMRILLTGAGGQLGGYLLRELQGSADAVIAWAGSRAVDLRNKDAVVAALREARPDAVIHAAAVSSVARCHADPQTAHAVNVGGTDLLARLADEARARLVFVSTDLVFDGENAPYAEDDRPSRLSVYGRTKADAEAAVLARPRTVVARVSLLFGPSLVGRPSFFDEKVAALRDRRPCPLFADEWRTPLSLRTAARALVALARSDYEGVLHVGGPERLSRLEMGRRLAAFLGVDAVALVETTRAAAAVPGPRPRDTSLDSSRWRALFPGQPWPGWEDALREMGVG